jgi:hypothetical protein
MGGLPDMETYTFHRNLPCVREVDVVIAGAGPAGIGAALSASRNGAKTLVFDAHNCVGGMATSGLVGPFMSSYSMRDGNMIIQGVFKELIEDLVADGEAIHPEEVVAGTSYSGYYMEGHDHVTPYDHEAFKALATKKILESGCEILLHTTFVDTIQQDGKIIGLVVANKSGLSVIKSKVVIDCTGDADVAAKSDVPFSNGSKADGTGQPATLFFRVGNVCIDDLNAHMKEHVAEIRPFHGPFSWLIREKADQWGDVPRGEVCMFEEPTAGVFGINVTRVRHVDATKVEDVTKAEIEGLRQARKVFKFLKENAPGFNEAIFMGCASTIGIRESRHIHGVSCITADDILNYRVPKNSIAVMATNLDTHDDVDSGGSLIVLDRGAFYGVPYTCLVPRNCDNLLVAGRSISADGFASSSIRMMPCCMAFGQAAGTAAAISISSHTLPKDIDQQRLRKILQKQGVYLGDSSSH